MESLENQWYEELPLQCPPADAIPANGNFYRIAQDVPTKDNDYFSQRKLNPLKTFEGIDECILRSVSVFSSIEEASKRLLLPKFRNNKIVIVRLTPKDGVIKKTFGPCHYSWWRTKEFDYYQENLAL